MGNLARLAAAAGLVTVSLLGATQPSTAFWRETPRIYPGMTPAELLSLLGPPDYTRSLYAREAYLYCPTTVVGLSITGADYATVWLRGGHVVGIRRYPTRHIGSCDDFFRAFRWADEPSAQEMDSCLKC